MNRAVGIIIDTDPGIDDVIAILLALAASSDGGLTQSGPVLQVLGLTTVGGNVPLALGTMNALAVLDAIGRLDIPVFRGSSRPLAGRFGYSFSFHGKTGLPGRLPKRRGLHSEQRATEFLAHRLCESPGGITLVALGPLTNLARLMQRYPRTLEKAGPIAVMGGAVNNPGNVTTHAEFNFYSDPQAADMVVSSGIPMVLVDLGASRQAALSRHQVQSLTGGNPFGELAIRLLQAWFRLDDSRDQFQFYDPLAMAAVIEPNVVSGIQLTLGVETRNQKHLGKSRVVSQGGNIHVAERVDRVLFFSLLKRLFAWEGIDPANLS